VDVGTQVLKETFDKIHSPGSLHAVLTTAPVNVTLTSMKKKKVINPTQWRTLMSPTVSSKDFDITLLVALLRNMCGLSAPTAAVWNSPPSPTDTTKEADIVRIRIHRNEVFAHANSASVDDAAFNAYWVDIKEPLVRLGGSSYQAIIDNLKTECMDPEREQHYQELLKQWKENEESVMEKLGEIEEKLDSTKSILQKMDEKLDISMQPVAHPVEDTTVEEFSGRLCALYNNLSQVKITPWDPDNTVHIDEIYTQLCWLRDDKRPSGIKQDKLTDYCEIFKGNRRKPNPDRILVYGRPGIGKSTFAQKISIDWARGKKEILKKFDLLLMIPLRNVCNSETVHDMLKAAKVFPVEDQRLTDSLHSYILQHKDRVLLVLDGFDEYSTGTPTPVFDIWKGDELRECIVVLTTRPIRGDEVKRFSDVQFQIKGFDTAQIKEFSMKFLDNQQEVEVFLKYIKKHKLEGIAEIPLLLLMLCLVWKERDREGLPESRVYLYSNFIQALCNHMAAKDGDGTVCSIEDYNAELIQIGELAFNALLAGSLEFDFEHLPSELINSVLIRVGVIQIVKLFSARPKKVVAFLHKSIQEFLAAWFVIHKLIPSTKNGLSCMTAIDSTDKAVAMVEVLKFVSQWSLEGSSAVLLHLESLREKQSPSVQSSSETLFLEDLSDDEKKLLELNLECFIETPVLAKAEAYPLLLKSTCGVLVIPDTILHLLTEGHVVKSKALPNHVLFNFRQRPSMKQRDYMASMMDDLGALVVAASVERKASDFVRQLSKFEILTSLFLRRREGKIFLHFTQVASMDVRILNELTVSTPNLLPESSHDQRHGEENTSKMNCQTRQHCFALAKKIEIDEIEDDEFIGVISNVVPLLESPQEITLGSSQESFEPHQIERLAKGMNITECLQRLRLHRMSLNEQSSTIVTSALHQASNLQELFLSENPMGCSVSCLAENLQHVQQLETLELCSVLMEEQAFSDLANSLCYVPGLKVLSLSRNNLGPSITVLADNLYSVRGLTQLELSQTQMDEEGVTALSNGLRSLAKLEVLDISHNSLGSAITVIADHLQRTPYLTELNMTNTEMGCDEATAVASSLKYLQNLRMLSVGSNPLGRGVCVLVQHLTKVPKLRNLNLASVQMGDEEVDAVSKVSKRTRSVAITTDYLDEKGEPLPAKADDSSFTHSMKSYNARDDDLTGGVDIFSGADDDKVMVSHSSVGYVCARDVLDPFDVGYDGDDWDPDDCRSYDGDDWDPDDCRSYDGDDWDPDDCRSYDGDDWDLDDGYF